MNGTVTMKTEVVAAATRELAEKSRAVCMEANKKSTGIFRTLYSDIEEIPVTETENELLVLTK